MQIERFQQQNRAKEVFETSLRDTRSILAMSLHELLQDSVFREHMTEGARHSLNRNLSGKLSYGQVEKLALYEGCNKLSSSELKKFPVINCLNTLPAGFRWSESELGQGLLSLVLKVKDNKGRNLSLVGEVSLGKDWLVLYPTLNRHVTSLGLAIRPSTLATTAVLAREGQSDGSQYVASLLSLNWIDQNYPLLFKPSVLNHFVYWPLSVLALIFCLTYIFLYLHQVQGVAKQKNHAMQQCKGFFDHESLPFNYKLNEDKSMMGSDFKPLLALVQDGLKALRTAAKEVTEKNSGLEAELQDLKQVMQKRSKRQEDLIANEALAQQVRESVGPLLDVLNKQKKRQLELSSSLQQVLSIDLAKLLAMLDSWQNGLKQKGSRKFIRGLAEQSPSHGPWKNRLEQELAIVNQWGQDALVQLGHSQNDLLTLSYEHEQFISLIDLWHGASKVKSIYQERNFASKQQMIDAFKGLQSFLNLSQTRHWTIECCIPDDCSLPRTLWACTYSVFYHIIMVLKYAGDGESSAKTILVRFKEKAKKNHLIFSVNEDRIWEQRGRDRMWQHMEKVCLLIEGYDMSFKQISAKDGMQVFSLEWASGQTVAETASPLPQPELNKGASLATL